MSATYVKLVRRVHSLDIFDLRKEFYQCIEGGKDKAYEVDEVNHSTVKLRRQDAKTLKDEELQIETSYRTEKERGLQKVGMQAVLCWRARRKQVSNLRQVMRLLLNQNIESGDERQLKGTVGGETDQGGAGFGRGQVPS